MVKGLFYNQVVDAADVVLEVLDARDPLGSRCRDLEETVLSSGTNKRLVLILNKIGEILEIFTEFHFFLTNESNENTFLLIE